jgi:hypothetical protein
MTAMSTPEQTRTPDAESEILLAVGELADGRTTRARQRLCALWDRDDDFDDPDCIVVHRSAIAHWLADTQSDVESALAWDERALGEAELLPDRHVPFAGTARTVAAMLPLLHVEVAQGHRRLDPARGAREHRVLVREHLALALAALASLPAQDREVPAREIARLEAQLSGLRPIEPGPGWQRRSWEGRAFWDEVREDDPLE